MNWAIVSGLVFIGMGLQAAITGILAATGIIDVTAWQQSIAAILFLTIGVIRLLWAYC